MVKLRIHYIWQFYKYINTHMYVLIRTCTFVVNTVAQCMSTFSISLLILHSHTMEKQGCESGERLHVLDLQALQRGEC